MPPHRDEPRRRVIRISAGIAGAAALATLVPFAGKIVLERQNTAEGEIVDLDLGELPAGQVMTVLWRGQPVWIVRRTPEMIARLHQASRPGELADPDSAHSRQPAYTRNALRSLQPEFFVAIALCTHLACTPAPRLAAGRGEGMPADWAGGFLCPCHNSTFDLAGRAHRNREAKQNLTIPPHRFLAADRLRLGEDPVAG